MTLTMDFSGLVDGRHSAEVARLCDAMEAAYRAGHYPRLTGSPRVHITLGSFKIQAGFRDPFGDCRNARPFNAVADSSAFGAGDEEGLGAGISTGTWHW